MAAECVRRDPHTMAARACLPWHWAPAALNCVQTLVRCARIGVGAAPPPQALWRSLKLFDGPPLNTQSAAHSQLRSPPPPCLLPQAAGSGAFSDGGPLTAQVRLPDACLGPRAARPRYLQLRSANAASTACPFTHTPARTHALLAAGLLQSHVVHGAAQRRQYGVAGALHH